MTSVVESVAAVVATATSYLLGMPLVGTTTYLHKILGLISKSRDFRLAILKEMTNYMQKVVVDARVFIATSSQETGFPDHFPLWTLVWHTPLVTKLLAYVNTMPISAHLEPLSSKTATYFDHVLQVLSVLKSLVLAIGLVFMDLYEIYRIGEDAVGATVPSHASAMQELYLYSAALLAVAVMFGAWRYIFKPLGRAILMLFF